MIPGIFFFRNALYILKAAIGTCSKGIFNVDWAVCVHTSGAVCKKKNVFPAPMVRFFGMHTTSFARVLLGYTKLEFFFFLWASSFYRIALELMFCEKESLQEREGALAVNIRWTQQIGQACD